MVAVMDLLRIWAAIKEELAAAMTARYAFAFWGVILVSLTYYFASLNNNQEVTNLNSEIEALKERVNLRDDKEKFLEAE